jgi:hypothetical protein
MKNQLTLTARDTPTVQSFCIQIQVIPAYVLSGGDSFLNVIHDVLNQQSVHGILTKHSIAKSWVILDLSQCFY